MSKNSPESAPFEESQGGIVEQNQPQFDNAPEQSPSISSEERGVIEQKDKRELHNAREQVDRAFSSPTIEQMNAQLKSNTRLQRGIKDYYKQFDQDLRDERNFKQEEVKNSGLTIDSKHDSSTRWGRTVKWLMGETPREREERISYNAVVLDKTGKEFKREYIPLVKTLERLFYGNSEEGAVEQKTRDLKRIKEEGRNLGGKTTQ